MYLWPGRDASQQKPLQMALHIQERRISASQTISGLAAQLEATLGLGVWLGGKAFAQHTQGLGLHLQHKGNKTNANFPLQGHSHPETIPPTNQDTFRFFFPIVTTNPDGQPFHQSFPSLIPKMVSSAPYHPPSPMCLQRRLIVQPR